jgi:hypothetical protein
VPSLSQGCEWKSGRPPGERSRRQSLATMSSDVIRAVKLAALEDGMNAWEIMEEVAKDWLAPQAQGLWNWRHARWGRP